MVLQEERVADQLVELLVLLDEQKLKDASSALLKSSASPPPPSSPPPPYKKARNPFSPLSGLIRNLFYYRHGLLYSEVASSYFSFSFWFELVNKKYAFCRQSKTKYATQECYSPRA